MCSYVGRERSARRNVGETPSFSLRLLGNFCWRTIQKVERESACPRYFADPATNVKTAARLALLSRPKYARIVVHFGPFSDTENALCAALCCAVLCYTVLCYDVPL